MGTSLKQTIVNLVALFVISVLLVTCGGESSQDVNAEATQTRSNELTQIADIASNRTAETSAPQGEPTSNSEVENRPTTAPTRTFTPAPSSTPEPTSTPLPTNTPAPTSTPELTQTPTPPPTATPEPTPTMTTDQAKTQYRGDVDVRDLDKNVHDYLDWKLHFESNVLTIQNFESGGTFLQLQVQWPGAGTYENEVIVVVYGADVDTSGIYEDSRVAIWGRPQEYFEATNVYGGTITQPLLYGDFLEVR